MTSARTPAIETPLLVPVSGPFGSSDLARLRSPRAEPWADRFVLLDELVGAAERGRLYRRVANGDLARVRAGVYLPSEFWSLLNDDLRFLARIRAEALASPVPLLFGVQSAAALWGLPMVGDWPDRPTVLAERAAGGRSAKSLERRCEGMPAEVWIIGGLATTGLARTVVDVARDQRFGPAVAVADFALARRPHAAGTTPLSVEKPELVRELRGVDPLHGHARAAAVVDFSDGDSGSVGESISRVTAYRLGFPRPVLQFAFRDHLGEMFADFWWPDYRLIGEFDGKGKYLRDEYTRGRSTAEVVLAEKAREDRLRALGAGVARWGWAEATSTSGLRRTLLAAGLPMRPPRPSPPR